MVFAGYSGFLHHIQLACQNTAIWQKKWQKPKFQIKEGRHDCQCLRVRLWFLLAALVFSTTYNWLVKTLQYGRKSDKKLNSKLKRADTYQTTAELKWGHLALIHHDDKRYLIKQSSPEVKHIKTHYINTIQPLVCCYCYPMCNEHHLSLTYLHHFSSSLLLLVAIGSIWTLGMNSYLY